MYNLNLVFDNFVRGQPWPNLIPVQNIDNGYGSIGSSYPYVVPLRLFYYAEDHGFQINAFHITESLVDLSFYPIGIGFFSFDVDYFSLISSTAMRLVQQGSLRVLFYYHEGDNPARQQTRLDELCVAHGLDLDCYRFVSGNTAAKTVDKFVYFADHELFYWRANKNHQPLVWNDLQKTQQFTMLSRTHKWWRASVMADLHRHNYLDQAYWSYNTDISINDNQSDNPIQTDLLPGLDEHINTFLQGAPYTCDDLDSTQHNQHHNVVIPHYRDAYFQVVLETMFDADQSGGTFLTEKTFKPIKHAQPFVLIAPPDSLETLRELGYFTFDNMIMNYYDSIKDNTQRWIHARAAITSILLQDLHRWSDFCYHQCIHNQNLFVSSKLDRLNKLSLELQQSTK